MLNRQKYDNFVVFYKNKGVFCMKEEKKTPILLYIFDQNVMNESIAAQDYMIAQAV